MADAGRRPAVRSMSDAVQAPTASWWLVCIADLTALVSFTAAVVVAATDGIDSGALIVGIPPLAVAIVASAGIYASGHWRRRWPLGLTIAVCALATVLAVTSFILPLLAATAPVCALLIAACIVRLSS